MKKRYLHISIIFAVLAVIAFTGYLRPETGPKIPVRILFGNNSNRVVFSHLFHSRASEVQCIECHHHHNDGEVQDPIACELCHPTSYDENYVAHHHNYFQNQITCVQCHHMEFEGLIFDHDAHEESVEDCTECHHGPDIEPEPQSCRTCHTTASNEKTPDLPDASHRCCQTCHAEQLEEDQPGCLFCHVEKDLENSTTGFTGCDQCHSVNDRNKFLPTKTDAFHCRCMNCHKIIRRGPYRENECNKCHFR